MKMATGRTWTDEEITYLEDNVGVTRVSYIAKKLGRTTCSIELKMKRLGISETKTAAGLITANQLGKILKVDTHAVTWWIKEKGLKSTKRTPRNKQKMWMIEIDNFWKRAERNKDLINFYKIEPRILCPEPSWLDEQRKIDYQTIPKRQSAKWTVFEDKRLIALVKGKYTQKEIGDLLDRSKNAIQRRVSRLRGKGLISMLKVTLRWSDEELDMLLELEKQGLSDAEISCELGREREHVVDKRRCLREKGFYQGRKVAVK